MLSARDRWSVRCRAKDSRPARHGDRGAAIVEFAISAPVMLLFMCGVGDLAVTLFARLLTASTVQGMVDLVTQSAKLRTGDVASIFNAAYSMMQPLSATNLSLRLTNVASDGNGHAFVYWSCGYGQLQPMTAKTEVTTMPGGSPVGNFIRLTKSSTGNPPPDGTNTTVVVVEAANDVPSPTGFVLKTTQHVTPIAFSLPRLSTFVGFPWDGIVGDDPPLPTAATTVATTSFATTNATVLCSYLK